MNELNEYEDFINLMAKKYGQNKYDDDLKQEGYIGLILAKQRFNEEMGNFENYAKVYIKGTMLMFLNRKTMVVKKQTNSKEMTYTYSIDNPIDDDGNTLADVIADIVDDDSMDDVQLNNIHKLNVLINGFDDVTKMIFTMRYKEEKSIKEISKQIKKSICYCRIKYDKALSSLQTKMGTPHINHLSYKRKPKQE